MKPFNIPNIFESLRADYLKGNLSLHEVAAELQEAGWRNHTARRVAISISTTGGPMTVEQIRHALWIYQPGNLHVQDCAITLDDGSRVTSVYGHPVDEYIAHLNAEREADTPEFGLYTFDEISTQIRDVEEKKFIGEWQDITEEEWEYLLNVLPPQKWERVEGVELFRMSEYMTGNITTHVARVYAISGSRFFKAYRRTSVPYKEIAQQVREFHHANPIPKPIQAAYF